MPYSGASVSFIVDSITDFVHEGHTLTSDHTTTHISNNPLWDFFCNAVNFFSVVCSKRWMKRRGHSSVCTKRMFDLTHWGRDKIDVISQTTFSSAFSWMKMYELRLIFHWILFLRVSLTIFQHSSHYLNQWWLLHWRIYASLGLNELMCLWFWMIPSPSEIKENISKEISVCIVICCVLFGWSLRGYFILQETPNSLKNSIKKTCTYCMW